MSGSRSKDTADSKRCGCCGQEEVVAGTYWCGFCFSHVRRDVWAPPEERTYFAQHGKGCPHQARAAR